MGWSLRLNAQPVFVGKTAVCLLARRARKSTLFELVVDLRLEGV